MTENTSSSLPPTPGAPAGSDWGMPAAPVAPAPKRSRGKVIAAGVGTLAVAGLIAGGAYAVTALGGGGAQPEEALPANTLAFAKIDLDPSSSQKIDAIRFLRKFPSAKEQTGTLDDSSDLRKVIFEQLQKNGQFTGLSYAADVEPWIGKRFGFAVVPGQNGTEPVPVVLLATTDAEKAKASLAKMTKDGGGCSVGEEFALCGQTTAAMDTVRDSATKGTLAKSETFAVDFKDLGEDGMVAFWADLAQLTQQLKSVAGAQLGDQPTQTLEQVKGRTFGALRFDGTDLELAAHVRDTGTPVADAKAGTGIGDLPADTIVAASVNGLGDSIAKQWPQLEKSLTELEPSALQQFTSETGLTLPDDLVKLVGNHTTFAFGGMEDDLPKIALKSDGDAAVAGKLASYLTGQGATVTSTATDGGTLLAFSDSYAAQVKDGRGLGDSEAFKKALPNVGDARGALYVDFARLIATFGTDMTETQKANVAPLAALGVSGTATDDDSDILVRLTTK
ncbi:MAG: DUF3352 domain-containing protein [Tetrasphaera sp.]